jgi:serine O-acetyltransferase
MADRWMIVVNGRTRIGANCRIDVGVDVGTKRGKSVAAPKIGDNCFIGPGAKIFGPISMGMAQLFGLLMSPTRTFLKETKQWRGCQPLSFRGKPQMGF